jgi:uncharacterized RmlC-like cupin family protein
VVEDTMPTPRPVCAAMIAELPDAGTLNAAVLAAWQREGHAPDLRRSHHFHGRFENVYIPLERVPECQPIVDTVVAVARGQLGRHDLHFGFWFNVMQPGHCTTLHSHAELDELLSAVYYVSCPPGSGDLVLHEDHATVHLKPEPGMLILFPPDIPHEVLPNASGDTRLSIAFNLGPLNADC